MSNTPLCTLVSSEGHHTDLPALRSWEFLRTDGESADAFRVECELPPALTDELPLAKQFYAACGGKRVFTGLVDEYELRMDENGINLCICGRGKGALLLDNQVRARTFVNAQLADILAGYVSPYGIGSERPDTAAIANFTIATGDTCMQVLKGFCAHAGLLQPHFDEFGTLLLRKQRQASDVSLTEKQVIRALYRDCRYGVISRQTLVHLKTSAVSEAYYPAFIKRGGSCRKVACSSGEALRATWRTAQQRVQAAHREEYVLELTLAGNFLAAPAQSVCVSLPRLGVGGDFVVAQVQSLGTQAGCTCKLTLLR